MIYLTYNDPPSGIYSSQVIDVCKFLNKNFDAKFRLISFISLRGFSANKSKIKEELPSAIVLPMFPGIQNWRMNIFLLRLQLFFLGKRSVIARGPFAASIALSLQRRGVVKQVCIDARGAYEAEFNEYKVGGDSRINKEISFIEKDVLLNADFRIAVSGKLVSYWKDKFNYKASDHVVIPCTLSSGALNSGFDTKEQRASFGFSSEDIVFVYAGSSAGWQSLKLADNFICAQMKANPNVKALLLTDKLPDDMRVNKEYAERVKIVWLDKDKMADALSCCDYGLLIRENSVTNRVSSPVKFAEYLAAGLQVIISENIGDYTEFVRQHGCGFVLSSEMRVLSSLSAEARQKSVSLAKEYFSKDVFKNEYKRIIDKLN